MDEKEKGCLTYELFLKRQKKKWKRYLGSVGKTCYTCYDFT